MSEFRLPSLSRRRAVVNSLTTRFITAGGISVIGVIILLMGYLLWVAVPAFIPASINSLNHASDMPLDILHVSANDSFEVVSLVRETGAVEFRDPQTFELIHSVSIANRPFKDVKPVFAAKDVFAARSDSDELLFFRIEHQVRFIDDRRVLVHRATWLFEESTIQLPMNTKRFDVYWREEQLRIVMDSADGTSVLTEYQDVDEMFELEPPQDITIPPAGSNYQSFMGPRGRWIFQIDAATGIYRLIEVRSMRSINPVNTGSLAPSTGSITTFSLLLGRHSVLVGSNTGSVTQFSLVTTGDRPALMPIRTMQFDKPIVHIESEIRRKGFLAVDEAAIGHLAYTTSERQLATAELLEIPNHVAFAPRADRLVVVAGDTIRTFEVNNPHPEISWSTTWNRVWYEGYEKPQLSWQSSAADTEFEAKFSLAPLLFGTLKAAFYAMLFAIPIAVMGAIYCANFMSPGMRAWVKPGIEIMAALPTVILGFLAGLWLAPIVESNLTAIMLLVFVLPIGVLVFSLLWSRLPNSVSSHFDGWFAAICVPVIIALAWGTLASNEFLADLIFGGDARMWFFRNFGVDYDQRNALIIGIAMGLAVIPTIFSIAEDAIYGVPQHLVHGSLALGATRWQTLVRVVLLTASPGIFAAIMIGFGRAVGETMIVLMATGNTPIMDFNLFQGMRTFAANIAVEMPESEANSTHFRILFLTALVLFMITFMFNTLAEVVRQRLRVRYGNL